VPNERAHLQAAPFPRWKTIAGTTGQFPRCQRTIETRELCGLDLWMCAVVSPLLLAGLLVIALTTSVAAQGLTPAERERQLFQDTEYLRELQAFEETGLRCRVFSLAASIADDQRRCELGNRREASGRQSSYDGADRSRAVEQKGFSAEQDR